MGEGHTCDWDMGNCIDLKSRYFSACLTPFPLLFATSSYPLQRSLLGTLWVIRTVGNRGDGSSCTSEPLPGGTEGAQWFSLLRQAQRAPLAVTVCGRVQKWVINLQSLLSMPPQGLGYLSERLNTYLEIRALYIPRGLWEPWGGTDSWHSLD